MSFERLPIVQSDPLSFTPGTIAVAPVAYDTAMVGALRDSRHALRFPMTRTWLLQHQHPDGTWGATAWHAHDRLVSTLAAILCLHRQHHDAPTVERALAVIPSVLARLESDANETIGFELIAPALIDRCLEAGLPMPTGALSHARQRRMQRLAADAAGTALFSLEALDHIPKELGRSISARGSLFASPAAAAAYLSEYPNTPALALHLTWLADQGHGGLPAVHPLDSFAAAWTCWHMDMVGLGHDARVTQLRRWVQHSWTAQGASFSDDFFVPNADDTALSLLVQGQEGTSPDIAVFEPFITPEGARCFVHEYDASVSTNIHILLALCSTPASAQRNTWIDWILQFLNTAQRADGLLADKWHASPLYPTSHAILATAQLDEVLCTALTAALIRSQHMNGAWGVNGGSAEETAYALLALCGTYRPTYRSIISSGIAALERLAAQPRPALWIGKSLYRPIPVVESAILAAWSMAHACVS